MEEENVLSAILSLLYMATILYFLYHAQNELNLIKDIMKEQNQILRGLKEQE